MRRAHLLLVVGLLLAGVTGACSSGSSTATGSTGSSAAASSSSSSSSTSAPTGPNLYVSLGDSYASGYQPGAQGGKGHNTTNGFAYQVVDLAKAKGYDLELANFGCAGATTTSIIETKGCQSLGPQGIAYPDQPQAAAAETYLRQHRGEVALITVSIGGNDVLKCAANPQLAACIADAIAKVKTNLATLVTGLRDAAGPGVPIVGTTYPDVVLGAYVTGSTLAKSLAPLSIGAFKGLINPTLAAAYESVGGTLVDVTEASGAYGPFTATTTLAPYGEIPVPVAKVCQLTFMCDDLDIHPRTEGYKLIADLVVAALPAR